MDLKTLLAKATPARSGDELAGIAAESPEERVRAQMTLADLPLSTFLPEPVVPYEQDEVTRLIIDEHDAAAFAPVAAMCVGDFRDWLLADSASGELLGTLAGMTPMAAAVSKIMRLQDLITVARKCPRGDALPQHHRAARTSFQRACSRIIRPTIPPA